MSAVAPRLFVCPSPINEFAVQLSAADDYEPEENENETDNSQMNQKPSKSRKTSVKKSHNGCDSIFKIPKALLVAPIPTSLPPTRSQSAVVDFTLANSTKCTNHCNNSAPRAPPPTPSRGSVHSNQSSSVLLDNNNNHINPIPLSTPTNHLRSASMDNSPRSSNVSSQQERNILGDMSNNKKQNSQNKLFDMEGQGEEEEQQFIGDFEENSEDQKKNAMQIMILSEGTEQMGDMLTLTRRYSQ